LHRLKHRLNATKPSPDQRFKDMGKMTVGPAGHKQSNDINELRDQPILN
jgi:hypothetical protein